MTSRPGIEPDLPERPIDRLVAPLTRYLHVEAAGGVMLLACTVIALVAANSPIASGFLGIWKKEVGFQIGSFEMIHSLKHWINDGLMAVFFFVVGLEVKRELVLGELREIRKALLPIAGAVGGMIVPAGIYLALQVGQPAARGWGIPMATDIAFVVGSMAILGKRIPAFLRVFLLSLAIVDDIGAILVIAIGYTEEIHLSWLLAGAGGIAVVFFLARLGVRSFGVFLVVSLFIWLSFHESGVHATIAGVILGLMTPARQHVSTGWLGQVLARASHVIRDGEWEAVPHRAENVRKLQRATRELVSPLEYLEGVLHPWVSFLIMPVFALANAGVAIALSDFVHPVALAVTAGLVIGKPVGIVVLSWIAVRLVLGKLPGGLNWMTLLGGGCLAGIGFTMALFIASLALENDLLDAAKIGIIAGSVLSAALGMGLLASGKTQRGREQ